MPTVEIELHTLVELLIRSNETDISQWPAAAREAGEMFSRIRAIEQRCIDEHGEFDWEKLDERTQDEYDGLHVDLGKSIDKLTPGSRNHSAEELAAELGLDLPR